jgi:hypothetical protein
LQHSSIFGKKLDYAFIIPQELTILRNSFLVYWIKLCPKNKTGERNVRNPSQHLLDPIKSFRSGETL